MELKESLERRVVLEDTELWNQSDRYMAKVNRKYKRYLEGLDGFTFFYDHVNCIHKTMPKITHRGEHHGNNLWLKVSRKGSKKHLQNFISKIEHFGFKRVQIVDSSKRGVFSINLICQSICKIFDIGIKVLVLKDIVLYTRPFRTLFSRLKDTESIKLYSCRFELQKIYMNPATNYKICSISLHKCCSSSQNVMKFDDTEFQLLLKLFTMKNITRNLTTLDITMDISPEQIEQVEGSFSLLDQVEVNVRDCKILYDEWGM
ncbi:unnamed protein product [Moneuplotes crassus]|uniref:Uncharacterized protein n=1 Tax=Euplotes crassus TaxID=5936 RepID=A0AAD1XRF8_EUPCR|nr:unnamed protein product [Moneuplotes crassus]